MGKARSLHSLNNLPPLLYPSSYMHTSQTKKQSNNNGRYFLDIKILRVWGFAGGQVASKPKTLELRKLKKWGNQVLFH